MFRGLHSAFHHKSTSSCSIIHTSSQRKGRASRPTILWFLHCEEGVVASGDFNFAKWAVPVLQAFASEGLLSICIFIDLLCALRVQVTALCDLGSQKSDPKNRCGHPWRWSSCCKMLGTWSRCIFIRAVNLFWKAQTCPDCRETAHPTKQTKPAALRCATPRGQYQLSKIFVGNAVIRVHASVFHGRASALLVVPFS